jgi:Methylamine utilisation protein MauE
MTAAASTNAVMGALSVQLAVFAALLLLASGMHKLIRLTRARAAIREFAGVPRSWAGFAAALVAATELLASVLLWMARYRVAGAVLAGVVWGAYLLLILRAIIQGRREVDCGCSFGTVHGSLGLFQVVRNVVLTSCAVFVAWFGAAETASIMMASAIPAALALLALYGALDQVMALRPPRTGEIL